MGLVLTATAANLREIRDGNAVEEQVQND